METIQAMTDLACYVVCYNISKRFVIVHLIFLFFLWNIIDIEHIISVFYDKVICRVNLNTVYT